MAKDVNMKKGSFSIKVSEDFVEHYKSLGYQVENEKPNNISVAKETDKIIKGLTIKINKE